MCGKGNHGKKPLGVSKASDPGHFRCFASWFFGNRMSFPQATSGSNGPSETSTERPSVSSASVRCGARSDPSPAGTCGGLSGTSNSGEAIMPNRFYLSTRKDRSAQAVVLLEALEAQGWERTLDWTDQNNVGPDGYADTALAEIAAVRRLTYW
jgi:hypothetical protein